MRSERQRTPSLALIQVIREVAIDAEEAIRAWPGNLGLARPITYGRDSCVQRIGRVEPAYKRVQLMGGVLHEPNGEEAIIDTVWDVMVCISQRRSIFRDARQQRSMV